MRPLDALATSRQERTHEEREVTTSGEEVSALRAQVRDLQIALLTSNEHGDVLQEHLYHLSASLTAEVRERQATEGKLQSAIQAMTKEKCDLETLVQILMEEGDKFAEEGEKARIDGLTQIANRRRFDEYLVHEWGRLGRLEQPIALLICDVDHFKLYNDHYGHQSGDECLKLVARMISQCLRVGDLVARFGGEEFAVILPNIDREKALRVAERVSEAITSAAVPHKTSPIGQQVSISIGVASRAPGLNDDPGVLGLIEEADRNLYLAKKHGRNRVSD